MASTAAQYQPRATEHGVLHTVVRRHLETFLAEIALFTPIATRFGHRAVPMVVVLGAANGMATLARATLVADIFGPRHYGSISDAIALGANGARPLAPVGASLLEVALGRLRAPVLATGRGIGGGGSGYLGDQGRARALNRDSQEAFTSPPRNWRVHASQHRWWPSSGRHTRQSRGQSSCRRRRARPVPHDVSFKVTLPQELRYLGTVCATAYTRRTRPAQKRSRNSRLRILP